MCQRQTGLGITPSVQLSFEQATQGQTFYARSLHAATPVVLPHLLLEGQAILMASGNDLFNADGVDHTFENDHRFWLELIRFGLKNNVLSSPVVTLFLDAPANGMEQSFRLGQITSQISKNINNCLGSTMSEYRFHIESAGLTLAPYLLEWFNEDFTYTLTVDQGSQYGSYDELAFRLDGGWGCSVHTITSVKDAPFPLQGLAYAVLSILCSLSEKSLVCDVAQSFYDPFDFENDVNQLSKDQLAHVYNLLVDNPDHTQLLDYLEDIQPGMIENLEMDYGEGGWVDFLASTINYKLNTGYRDKYSHLVDYRHAPTSIKALIKECKRWENGANPLIAHPLYTKLKLILKVLNDRCLSVASSPAKVGSDIYLPELSLISLDLEKDNAFLKEHHEFLSSIGETASFTLDLKNEDLIAYCKNMVLADLLLCVFDT